VAASKAVYKPRTTARDVTSQCSAAPPKHNLLDTDTDTHTPLAEGSMPPSEAPFVATGVQVCNAYKILSNPTTRAEYDRARKVVAGETEALGSGSSPQGLVEGIPPC
jgi:hypothetical protein